MTSPRAHTFRPFALRQSVPILFVLGIGPLLSGCPPTANPDNVDLQFSVRDSILFERNFTPGILDTNFAWGASELGPLPSFPLTDDPQFHLRFLFHSGYENQTFSLPNGPPEVRRNWRTYREAHLFEADPQDVYNRLSTITNNCQVGASYNACGSAWQALTRTTAGPPPWSLPDSLVVPDPTDAVPQGAVIQDPLGSTEFTQGGYVGFPATNSVTAVRVLASGSCSQEVNVQSDILNTLGSQLPGTVLGQTCMPNRCDSSDADGEVNFLNATSYLTHKVGALGNLGGGFLLQGDVRVHSNTNVLGLNVSDCAVYFNYSYEYALQDGIFTVKPGQNALRYDHNLSLCNGKIVDFHIPAVGPILQSALENDLPATIYGASLGRQTITQDSLTPANATSQALHFLDYNFECVPDTEIGCNNDADCNDPKGGYNGFDQFCDTSGGPAGNVCRVKDPCGAGTVLYPDGTHKSLAGARTLFNELIADGAARLGIPPGQVPRLQASIDQRDQYGRSRSFRCVNSPSTNLCPRPRCEYTLRAKRLNATANTAEIVFFDTADEYDNPAFATVVATFSSLPPGGGDASVDYSAYRRVCQREYPGTLPGSSFYRRPFASINVGDQRCATNTQCPPPPPTPPPPPPPGCACTQNADCPWAYSCNQTNGVCELVCDSPAATNTAGCTTGYVCSSDTHRCEGMDPPPPSGRLTVPPALFSPYIPN